MNTSQKTPIDQHAAHELHLFIENDSMLYKSQYLPMVKNMQRRKKAGTFDPSKAPGLLLYLVHAGAKKYFKDVYVPGIKIEEMFPFPLCMQLARDMAEDMESAIDAGEYDDLLKGNK